MIKNNYALALLSGLLLAFGWPTYGFPILLFIAFIPLLLVENNIRNSDKKRKRLKVLLFSYITFVIWNSITTWWLWYSTPFGMLFAILVNSLLMSLVFILYHFVAKRSSQKISLLFIVALWISFEKLHLHWDFSWPWLNLGNSFSEHTNWIQWYEYTGTFGGSLWIWIINIGIFKTIQHYTNTKNKKSLSIGIAKNILLITIPVIISLFILKNYVEERNPVNIILVQPNVDPYSQKYNQENTEIAQNLIQLTQKHITHKTDFIIAPETTFSKSTAIDNFQYSEAKNILQTIPKKYPNTNILTGIDFYQLYLQKEKPTLTANKTQRGDWFDVYNAAILLNNSDSIQKYIKSKLVVGVENFPYKNTFEPILGNIMIDLGGTVASRATQKERSVFTSSNKKFKAAPVICYESVYGDFVTDYVKKGANFLAIITNDGWWSISEGHKQHLSYAKLRAIETRRSIARSANTGISAFINQTGVIEKSLAYGKKGVVKGQINTNTKMTFYTRYGDYIARISIFIAILLFLFSIAKKRK